MTTQNGADKGKGRSAPNYAIFEIDCIKCRSLCRVSTQKSRKRKSVVRQVTAKQRYARALAAVTAWCRENRHLPIREQHTQLVAKMRGHYAYYGISGNFRRLSFHSRLRTRIYETGLL